MYRWHDIDPENAGYTVSSIKDFSKMTGTSLAQLGACGGHSQHRTCQ